MRKIYTQVSIKTKMNIKFYAGIVIFTAFVILLTFSLSLQAIEVGERPQQVEDEFIYEPDGVVVESWVEDLEIPWEITFLPETDRALVTERPARVRLIVDGELAGENYLDVPAEHIGEGGLMGLDHHPEFPQEPYIYIMYTYRTEAGELYSRVARLTDRETYADNEEVIIDQIPAARNHNGGRIKFGPDGKLYITAGDVWDRWLAQDYESLAGKILRVNPDGSIPEDNPFENSPVYSLGHRNPQGLAWNERGHFFISDHGPSGEEGLEAKDMIKIIEPGGNYGWPERIGYFGDGEYIDPLILWPDNAVPPSGSEFVDGDLFVATLASRSLIRISLTHQTETNYTVDSIERWFAEGDFSGKYGRLRNVTQGPDGALYVLTSNRDGRGSPLPGDDRIYRIELEN